METAEYWIETLRLQKHPEGGFYRETYRAEVDVDRCCLPSGFAGRRNLATAIYFLLAGKDFSAFHRLCSDEIWHYHTGSTLTLHVIEPAGRYRELKIGPDAGKGEVFQAVVAAGSWFGATVDDESSYTLVGCTVSPGFDFQDFEFGTADRLVDLFPAHAAIIERLTRR